MIQIIYMWNALWNKLFQVEVDDPNNVYEMYFYEINDCKFELKIQIIYMWNTLWNKSFQVQADDPNNIYIWNVF